MAANQGFLKYGDVVGTKVSGRLSEVVVKRGSTVTVRRCRTLGINCFLCVSYKGCAELHITVA